MSRKTIQFGDGQTDYIALAVKQRGYRSDSEYIRDLVRRDEEKNREYLTIKAAIQEGYESGVSPKIRTVDEIMEKAITQQKFRKKEN